MCRTCIRVIAHAKGPKRGTSSQCGKKTTDVDGKYCSACSKFLTNQVRERKDQEVKFFGGRLGSQQQHILASVSRGGAGSGHGRSATKVLAGRGASRSLPPVRGASRR
jgi:hypothetical protein